VKTYTGIGSRDISKEEEQRIDYVVKKLYNLDYICFSGNAPGSDITFQRCSNNKCVVFLPWKNFNKEMYDPEQALDHFVVGNEKVGLEAAEKFHPNFKNLSCGGRALHARNYFQIFGYDVYPKSEFVICCASEDSTRKVLGGTGQAIRIAKHNHLEIINLRNDIWKFQFETLINKITLFE
jgi:hypothetical protein